MRNDSLRVTDQDVIGAASMEVSPANFDIISARCVSTRLRQNAEVHTNPLEGETRPQNLN